MDYEVVLFDADGTLFDFERAEIYALENSFLESNLFYEPRFLHDYKLINQEVWQRFERGEIDSARLRTLRFELFCGKVGIDVDPVLLSERYLSWLGRAGFLLDGAREVIEEMSAHLRLAIVTNGLSDVQRGRFGRVPILHHFEAVVISEEIGAKKPDPAIFDHTLSVLDHRDKSTVLMVGDSLSSDIQGGVNFGIDTCWYNPSMDAPPAAPVPTHVVSRLGELPALCGGAASLNGRGG